LLGNIEKHMGSQFEPHANFVKAHAYFSPPPFYSLRNIYLYICSSCSITICQGVYPQALIKEWDSWAKRKQTENDRPDTFDREQLFCTFVLENAGTDLEHFVLQDLFQAKSVLLQVCLSLAAAEKVRRSQCRKQRKTR